MSDFYQRLRENLVEARRLCVSGNHETTLPVRADDFCAIHRILYRCFKEEETRQSEQIAQGEKEVWQ